ncbi:MAG TPA: GMC family oxidoreductase [Solirubrobacterales bacterium]|nr:GMC family oxidoreductase [Solirubrobacterales bacterium]
MQLTREERQLAWLMRASAFIFSAETLVYLLPALIGDSRDTWGALPFVINSFLKAGLIGGVCFVAAADIRRFERVVSLVVVGLALWVPAGVLVLVFGHHGQTVDLAGFNVEMTWILVGGVVFEGGLAAMYAFFHRRALRAANDTRYLSAGQFRTLSSVAETLLWSSPDEGPPPELTPDEVARRADHYLAGFAARRKWVMKAALVGINLYPLLFAKPTFTLMGLEERRVFLEKRFGEDVARRRIGSLRRWLIQGMVRLAQQVVYLGFYSDERTWPAVGYVPFSKRPAAAGVERKRRSGLKVESAKDVEDEPRSEVVVVGSGAAGAVISYRLAEAGHDVLLLERGPYVDPADFSEDEVEMLTTLYRDGAVQLARDFKLQVLQGMCVGGTTVVNNAVSIEPPPRVLERWRQTTGGRLDLDRVQAGIDSISRLLRIGPQGPPHGADFPLGVHKLIEGLDKLREEDPSAPSATPIQANIHDCLGCGYCNIGCAYGRKLSMLDTLLPQAQASTRGSLRIVADAAVERIETSRGQVSELRVQANGRRVRVNGDRYVLSAGAINSSYLLGRSGLGGPMVGRGLSFNVGSPVTAEFDEPMDTYAGLQITHVIEPGAGGPDVIMETWFNPVVSQAMAMPGWFEQHRRNMRAYNRMAATGVLVGTESNGRVAKALFGGADVVYEPTESDLRRLVEGLKLVGRIYLKAGAKKVMPSTFQYHAFTTEEQLERLDEIVRTNEDIQLGTGHPQGGNSLGAEPTVGPVDPVGFRVHGVENLHLCDASVFPTSLGVNPQLTTMALAEYASQEIHDALTR